MTSTRELISAAALFADAGAGAAAVSPDGEQMAFIAAVDGVANIHVRGLAEAAARQVTNATGPGVHHFRWAADSKRILFEKDAGGDECWHLHVLDLATGAERDLTPFERIHARVLQLSPRHPGIALVEMNLDDASRRDVWRVSLDDGDCSRVLALIR